LTDFRPIDEIITKHPLTKTPTDPKNVTAVKSWRTGWMVGGSGVNVVIIIILAIFSEKQSFDFLYINFIIWRKIVTFCQCFFCENIIEIIALTPGDKVGQ
jgi:hypothetical protein